MSFSALLNDSCIIQRRIVTRGKVDTESWQPSDKISCRVLKKERYQAQGEKVQRAQRIRTIFVLPKGSNVALHDRIAHEDRIYEVIEVISPRDSSSVHHINAICDAVV